jgi:streptomycin 6-kinase
LACLDGSEDRRRWNLIDPAAVEGEKRFEEKNTLKRGLIALFTAVGFSKLYFF